MIEKRILAPDRVRRPPQSGFSWVDRRFLREFSSRLSHDGVVLYFFLAAVSDKHGLSFYRDATIAVRLRTREQTIVRAREELIVDEHGAPAARNESREHRRQLRRWTPRPDSSTSRNLRARLPSRCPNPSRGNNLITNQTPQKIPCAEHGQRAIQLKRLRQVRHSKPLEMTLFSPPLPLASQMVEMRLWRASEYDVQAALDWDIDKKGERSLFVKVADNEYALRSREK